MRWRRRERKRRDPDRWRIRFALLPTEMDDGTVVWLERYWYQRWADWSRPSTDYFLFHKIQWGFTWRENRRAR